MENDLLKIISAKMDSLSKSHKKIAEYIIKYYDKTAFMTAQKLGTTVGVSESTVVRFACELGYMGYPDLQCAMQQLMRNNLTAVQRMEVTANQCENGDIFEYILSSDIERIRKTMEQISKSDFNRAVDMIASCHTIYIIGSRSSDALASFLWYYFNLIFPRCKNVKATTTSETFEQIMRIDENDVIIGISFPRYSMQTAKALKYARTKGANVIALTDSRNSPIAKYAHELLLAQGDIASFADSLVAPMSVINALIAAVSVKNIDMVSRNLQTLEQIWQKYDVYTQSDEEEI